MTYGPISVAVSVAGQVLADSATAFYAGQPTVFDGLAITWGRSTTVDQPGPSAATFSVKQRGGGSAFLGQMYVGAKVAITATGIVYPDPTVSTITDASFEAATVGFAPSGTGVGRVTVTAAQAATGSRSVAMQPAPPVFADSARWDFPPAPFSDDITAWDQIPKTALGQTWRVGATVWATPYATITLSALSYTTPGDRRPDTIGVARNYQGNGTWQQLIFDVQPTTANRWIGIRIAINPLGARWSDLPASQSWAATPGTWDSYTPIAYVDDLTVLAPAPGTPRTVLAFSGRITDQDATWERALAGGSLAIDITARDFTADQANEKIGDNPWAVNSVWDRVNRILSLSATIVSARIASTIQNYQLTYRDVDSQAPAGLITEIAASVDAVAWSATHITTGPYYWLEDPSMRPSLLVLIYNSTTGLVDIEMAPPFKQAINLGAGEVLEDPLHWTRDVSDIVTRVDIAYQQQGTDDKGQPTATERHTVVIDPVAESTYGQRAATLSTQLINSTDAQAIGNRMLARLRGSAWRLGALTWDTGSDVLIETQKRMMNALDLLDGTIRIGKSVTVANVPSWTPTPGTLNTYVEGGKWSIDKGYWLFEMTVSKAGGLGQSITWAQLDSSWTWAQLDPQMLWSDLNGVGQYIPS